MDWDGAKDRLIERLDRSVVGLPSALQVDAGGAEEAYGEGWPSLDKPCNVEIMVEIISGECDGCGDRTPRAAACKP